ncbi:hypothetical protein F4806DRAFT_463966 [Annulohypoxylon nitens]|nr:hypothetical protein F4806DRAFT_463966 [Annulohypoxylon nitens]
MMSFPNSTTPVDEHDGHFIWIKMGEGHNKKLWFGCCHCLERYSKPGNLKNHLELVHRKSSATWGSAPAQGQGLSLNTDVMSPIPSNPVSIQLQPGDSSDPMSLGHINRYSYAHSSGLGPQEENGFGAASQPLPQQATTDPQLGHHPQTTTLNEASIASPPNNLAISTLNIMPTNITDGSLMLSSKFTQL